MVRLKQLGDVFLALVDRGRDQVRGRLFGELHDVFAQVGFQRFDAVRLEVMVEARLLTHHRLRLDDLAHVVGARDVEHDAVHVGGSLRPMHDRAARGGRLLEQDQIGIEVRQRTIANCRTGGADLLEVVQLPDRLGALVDKAAPETAHVLLEMRVIELQRRFALEVHRSDLHW
jgi:hypothetical protein